MNNVCGTGQVGYTIAKQHMEEFNECKECKELLFLLKNTHELCNFDINHIKI
tara:strand:- start:799 stop:954 length:156 start_codon:yes stop_codon:yes gene_type:complete